VTYPHPVPPPPHPVVQPAPVGGVRGWWRGLSGGMLAFLSITTVFLCCVTPIVFCAFGGVFDTSTWVDESPEITITNCAITNNEYLSSAKVEYTIKQSGINPDSYSVSFDIQDADGTVVGSATDYVSRLDPDSLETAEAFGMLRGKGETCHLASVR
jgi:hypothetical protein